MKLLYTILLACVLFACTSNNVPLYNPQEFETVNYQKNVDNAVDATDILSDFDQSKIPQLSVDASDISNLVQADLYYNQGEYDKAYQFYKILAFKYKNPRIIYKAIVCLEHVGTTDEQFKNLNELINLFIELDPDSKISKLFTIKIALNDNNLNLAKENLDYLMANAGSNDRAILLFISSIISNDIAQGSYATLNSFAHYVATKYKQYPEAHLVAALSYSLTDNAMLYEEQIIYIQQHYPNWYIPLYWSLDILIRHKNFDTAIKVLTPMVSQENPDEILQNIYVAILLNNGDTETAKAYLLARVNSKNRDNILIDLGILNARDNQYDAALIYFEQIKQSDAQLNSQAVILLKGAIYDYQNQPSKAINEYQQVTSPQLISISNIMLLNAYSNQNNYMAVDNLLAKMAKQNKLNEEQTILFKVSFYVGEEKFQQAYTLLNSKIKLYGGHPDYLYQYAAVSGTLNYTKQAINLYKKLLQLEPKNAYGYNDLAYIYAEQTKNYQQAQKYAQVAYQLSPHDPNVLDTLGWVYYKIGDYPQALTYIKASYEANYEPDSAKHLAKLYSAMGEHDLASKVVIINKSEVEQHLKQELIKKVVFLLSYAQFGITVK